jgi:hypothetical protein
LSSSSAFLRFFALDTSWNVVFMGVGIVPYTPLGQGSFSGEEKR